MTPFIHQDIKFLFNICQVVRHTSTFIFSYFQDFDVFTLYCHGITFRYILINIVNNGFRCLRSLVFSAPYFLSQENLLVTLLSKANSHFCYSFHLDVLLVSSGSGYLGLLQMCTMAYSITCATETIQKESSQAFIFLLLSGLHSFGNICHLVASGNSCDVWMGGSLLS